jgi:AcrR family transcriptional regulator/DNA-binding MarR family transcriptional regulator
MSVAQVAGRARVSRSTFYDEFADREDCFLAVFDEAVGRVEGLVLEAYDSASAKHWRERVRGALLALLMFFDEEPGIGSVLVVDALMAGQRVLERRAEVMRGLSAALDREAPRSRTATELPALMGEGVIGAVFSVIHTRLAAERHDSLLRLLNPLMAIIVLPYLGPAGARRELELPTPKIARDAAVHRRGPGERSSFSPVSDPLADLPMRLTYRTMRVLGAIAELGGRGAYPSNREIGDAAGAPDQGQISKLLQRLEGLGLIENATPSGRRRDQPTGEPNAWRLTPRGEEVQRATGIGGTDDENRGERA